MHTYEIIGKFLTGFAIGIVAFYIWAAIDDRRRHRKLEKRISQIERDVANIRAGLLSDLYNESLKK